MKVDWDKVWSVIMVAVLMAAIIYYIVVNL